MAKVIFGIKPKAFESIEVPFKGPDGVAREINVVYKYRTATEYGAFLNETFKGGDPAPLAADGSIDYEALFARTNKRTAALLAGSIESWDVEGHPPSLENLQRMADEVPAGTVGLASAYRAACIEGRLGN